MGERSVSDPSGEIDIQSANAEIPRKVSLDSASFKVLCLALLMLLFGVGVLIRISYETITNLHLRQVLRREGQSIEGRITESSENRGGQSVRYAFSVDGASYSGQAGMEANDYTLPGDRNGILIRYLPNNPRINQPANWRWVSIWDFFPFLLLLSITAFGSALLLKILRLNKLMRKGTVAVGRVTASVPKKGLFTVYYEFTGEDNTTAEGSCILPDEYGVGTALPVIYLRSDLKRNNYFPVGGFHVAERSSLPDRSDAFRLDSDEGEEVGGPSTDDRSSSS